MQEWLEVTSLSQLIPIEPCLIHLGCFYALKAPAFLLRMEGVSALLVLSFFLRTYPDLFMFDNVLGMNKDPFICLSTESDIRF